MGKMGIVSIKNGARMITLFRLNNLLLWSDPKACPKHVSWIIKKAAGQEINRSGKKDQTMHPCDRRDKSRKNGLWEAR